MKGIGSVTVPRATHNGLQLQTQLQLSVDTSTVIDSATILARFLDSTYGVIMRTIWMCLVLLVMSGLATAQSGQSRELTKQELQQLLPQNYFFAGQTATTQLRNAGGVRFADNHVLILAMVRSEERRVG